MSNTEATSLPTNTEVETALKRLLHDFRNQLGGVKLYTAFLKQSLANNTLEVSEGMEVCDKILEEINTLTARAKEAGRLLQAAQKTEA